MDATQFRSFLLTISLFIPLFLSSCTELGLASTGAQATYNRHTLKATLQDHCITKQAYNRIYNDQEKYLDTSIAIDTFHGEVLLTGEIPTRRERDDIEQIVKNIDGVKKVYNLTLISPPLSPLTQVSDAWITTKIKAKIIAEDDIDPSEIKVITERGTVFLMGTLFPDQAKLAVQIAQTTDGVQDVVRVFNYLRISKT